MTITITHTHEDGTLVEGTSKGDGTNRILKDHGFRWFGSLGCWGIQRSRDRQANEWKINRAANALRAAGHDVEVEIDNTHRDTATVEADRAARQAARVDALAAKAERADQRAADADAANERATAALPPGGEPIKIGHHSERRHRKAIEKAHTAMSKSIAADQEAERAHQRATSAARTTDRRYHPQTVARRIAKLQAEQRADQRELDGYSRTLFVSADTGKKYIDTHEGARGHRREQLQARMAQRGEDIAYWESVREQQIADGIATNYGPDTIAVGDLIEYDRRWWCKVVRINRKSVSVETQIGGYTSRHTVAYPDITQHKAASTEQAG